MRRRPGWVRNLFVTSLAGAVALFPYAAGRRVPVLRWVDFAVHETGHLLAGWLPEIAMFLAGSVAEVGVPLWIAAYFTFSQRDLAAGGICLAWAGAAAWSVSVYAGDAVVQRLPIVGGEHDWAFLMGPDGFDAPAATRTVSRAIEIGGLVAAVLGVSLAVWATVSAVFPVTETTRGHPRPVATRRGAESPRAVSGDPWRTGAGRPGGTA